MRTWNSEQLLVIQTMIRVRAVFRTQTNQNYWTFRRPIRRHQSSSSVFTVVVGSFKLQEHHHGWFIVYELLPNGPPDQVLTARLDDHYLGYTGHSQSMEIIRTRLLPTLDQYLVLHNLARV
ncbi:MAG: hypothetical protein AB7L09_02410 [Nitrospira sp.]